MLETWVADRLVPLAAQLADHLADPLPDPMQADWVAVPTIGLQRWLRLELARQLGASRSTDGASRGDGVAANIHMPFPGALRRAVVEAAHPDPDRDPWRLDRLTWAVLGMLAEFEGDHRLGPLAHLPDGATAYGRARRTADLFDRYDTWRPDMIRRWAEGDDLDAQGRPLGPASWQAHAWRLVRERVGFPSPAERLPILLDQLRRGQIQLDLPPRLAFFGTSGLPGGRAQADLLFAVAAQHDLRLYLYDPAPTTSARLAESPNESRARADETWTELVRQPLLRSWGRPARETHQLLQQLAIHPQPLPTPPPSGQSLLATLQRHLSGDGADSAPHELDPDDPSIRIHHCQGDVRQVEVLRDTILAALRDDPTLAEDDIVVVCPDLGRFAPLIEGAFGPSADSGEPPDELASPRLRYHVTDRSIRTVDPLASALSELLALLGGRFAGSAVLDFCGLGPVADRFGLSDDDLAQIADWLDATNVRWGLDVDHRQGLGLPVPHTNTWDWALRQLVMGMAIHDDIPTFGPNRIPAFGVEGSMVDVLDRLLDILTALHQLNREWAHPAPVGEWSRRLLDAVAALFHVDPNDGWQLERLRRTVDSLRSGAEIAGERDLEISLSDVRQMLASSLLSQAARPRFFDGAITITSLRPLRTVPHRVVCVLGLDDGALRSTIPSGDDLLAADPDIGEPDQRADQRQSLLELVHAAGDRLVILRNGHDINRNEPIPPAVPLLELLAEIESLTGSTEPIEVSHSRQSHDESNLDPSGPISFSRHTLNAALAARTTHQPSGRVLLGPVPVPPVVELDDLVSLLNNPLRFFYRQRLNVSFATVADARTDTMPIDVDALERWSLGSQLLDLRRDGGDWDRRVGLLESRGALPVGRLGENLLNERQELVRLLIDGLDAHDCLGADEPTTIDATVSGVRIVGQVADTAPERGVGPVQSTVSEIDNRVRWPLWLRLLALTIDDPDRDWKAVAVGKRPNTSKLEACVLEGYIAGSTAAERVRRAKAGLGLVLDLRNRALREPLPLFSKLTLEATDGRWELKAKPWARDPGGVAAAPETLAAFGRLGWEEANQLPAHDGDPVVPDAPPANRMLRYHLWLENAIRVTTGGSL